MAFKRRGKRVSAAAAARRRKPAGRKPVGKTKRRKDEPMRPKERWHLTQLVISGSLFVLLVAVTWFLPGRMERLNETLSGVINRNMDVQAVFSAVGKAFAGEERAGEEIYRAVFQPTETESAPELTDVELELQDTTAWDVLREYRKGAVEVQPELVKNEREPAGVETLAYVLYSEQNLPENVSLEQALLGFDYCTPVCGSLSSGFGYRDHPTEGDSRFHYGVDLAADSGTDICSFADGTVLAVGESSSYGKYCIVKHDSGYRTLYAHCSRVTATSGAAVRRGQVIAKVGETGMATGPHLHFELQQEGTYLNPVYYVAQV